LVGAKNAGKSSLLNMIAGRRKALTGPQPGLTRDPVRVTLAMAGYPVEWIDLPGVGAAVDDLDARAMARARALVADVDLLLLVVDRSQGVEGLVETWLRELELALPEAWLMTKCDLSPGCRPRYPIGSPLAVVRGDRLEAAGLVHDVLAGAIRQLRGLPEAGRLGRAACTSQPQQELLLKLRAAAVADHWDVAMELLASALPCP
jgi:small GTP-binding protein